MSTSDDMSSGNNTSSPELTMFLANEPFPTTEGLAGLDEACNADANKPANGGNFKAFVAAPNRLPDAPGCEHTLTADNDWVLAPNARYVNLDGELMFETNAIGIFDAYPEGSGVLNGGAVNFATALDKEWCFFEDAHCESWTSATGPVRVGWTRSYGGALLDGGELMCGSGLFVCVEQP